MLLYIRHYPPNKKEYHFISKGFPCILLIQNGLIVSDKFQTLYNTVWVQEW